MVKPALLRRLEGPQTLGRGPWFWAGFGVALILATAYPLLQDAYTVGNTIYFFLWVFMALGLCLIWVTAASSASARPRYSASPATSTASWRSIWAPITA